MTVYSSCDVEGNSWYLKAETVGLIKGILGIFQLYSKGFAALSPMRIN